MAEEAWDFMVINRAHVYLRYKKMRKYILYGHDGSANHGCEALVRTTAELLDYKKNQIMLVSSRPNEDFAYRVSDYCKIIKKGVKVNQINKDLAFFKAYCALKLKHDYSQMDDLSEIQALGINKNDVALAIGGDSYCYSDSLRRQLFHQHNIFKSQGMKTVLWGCSFEKELLKDKKTVEDLQSFDLITARESITYEMLKGINPNTILTVDSAFLLKGKQQTMFDHFEGTDFVGINTSPLIEESENIPSIARKNFEKLIESILNETNYKVLLIPHVVRATNDDRSVLEELFEKFKESNRIILIQDHNCCELKGYIMRCRFFIGARTHATIAAYSTGVPTLVLGYSTKSKGIAKDIFGSYENYVLSVQGLKTEMDLTNSWKWMQNNEDNCRRKLHETLPEYIQHIYEGVERVKSL